MKELIEIYKTALEKIVDPIGFIRKELKEGEQLNGAYAVQISNDANYLKQIAEEALNRADTIGLQSKGKTKEGLSQLFRNNSDCYADTGRFENDGSYTEGEVIQAMTEEKFIELMQSHANQDGYIERFKRPADDEVVSAAILFNEGKLEPEKLSDMVALVDFILDRLYENGDMSIPTVKENADPNEPQP